MTTSIKKFYHTTSETSDGLIAIMKFYLIFIHNRVKPLIYCVRIANHVIFFAGNFAQFMVCNQYFGIRERHVLAM